MTTAPLSSRARAVGAAASSGSGAAAFAELLDLLRPVPQGRSSYRAEAPSVTWGAPYGGLLVAQALAAASATVRPGLWVRSLHAYFVQAGDGGAPTDIDVHTAHEGRSSAWRTVEVIQSERLLLRAEMLFATDSDGPSHATAPPEAGDPAAFPNVGDELAGFDDTFRPWTATSPFDLRYATPPPRLALDREPRSTTWVRTAAPAPDDRALAAALLAYASDLCLLDSCLRPHGLWFGSGSATGFSLDHSMWFHGPARLDDWLVVDQTSPGMRGGRGLSTAQMHARDGELLATATQLGSIRPAAPTPRHAPRPDRQERR
ncbi:MAG: thioesterase family protein [Nocardioides alkalitolerans]